MATPFVKWAGGKRKLIHILEENLPKDLDKKHGLTYIEPFVGGGAMLFYMLAKHPNIRRAIINDVNSALINCYRKIKCNHKSLIGELQKLHNDFHKLQSQSEKKEFYYSLREDYNAIPVDNRNTIRAAALFLFFNKTCFNGLYRENSQGNFNVPYGRYVNPTICNEQVILDVHDALQRVEICQGDYSRMLDKVRWSDYNFFYLDPPYRPLLGSNNFRQYTKNAFGDSEQEELKRFCDVVSEHKGHFMLSNSDSESAPGVSYFEELYHGYEVQRISAPRTINAFVPGVQIVTEILVKNY